MSGRDRKDASRALGIALQARYMKMMLAEGADEISVAAVDLGKCFNDNIAFVIWVLRTYGGESLMPPEKVNNARPTSKLVLPPLLTAGADVDLLRK